MRIGTHLLMLLVTAPLAVSPSADSAAECIRRPGDSPFGSDDVEFVFDGSVIAEAFDKGLPRYSLTVHRVWKGHVAQQFDVYGVGEINDIPALTWGKRYVVAASRVRLHRPKIITNLSSEDVLLLPCGAVEHVDAGDFLRALGPGFTPAQQRSRRQN